MNNEPAFPITDVSKTQFTGMTLRDYFAAKAIQGLMANPDISAAAADAHVTTNDFREGTAIAAYAVADAMLKARGEK